MGEKNSFRVSRPSWIHHKGGPIYSLDCHPSQSKLLTGGQGDHNAGIVQMWNVASFVHNVDLGDKENLRTDVRRICSFEFEDCVNIVRWSSDGSRFASAGPAANISVFEFVAELQPSDSLGGDEAPCEHWRSEHTLRAHSAEVLHLDWSNDGAYLASCSVDNRIVVWDARALPEIVVTLRGHTDFVKGLAFDPLGKYLASQSADKTLKVWHTQSWQCVSTIDECFKDSVHSTSMSRPGWSPDGSILVAVNCMNNGAPTAQIIRRSVWAHARDFVGHRRALIVARFSPRLFPSQTAERPPISLLALAGKDQSLSIWKGVPSVRRPLLVLEEVFNTITYDLAWHCAGRVLFACSKQGAVAIVRLPESLGLPLGDDAMAECLRSSYDEKTSRSWLAVQQRRFCAQPMVNGSCHLKPGGNNLPVGCDPSATDSCDANILVDAMLAGPTNFAAAEKSPEKLKKAENPKVVDAVKPKTTTCVQNNIEMENASGTDQNAEKTAPQVVPAPMEAAPGVQQKQTETRLKSGKRRIQPIFLGSMTPVKQQPDVSSRGGTPSKLQLDSDTTNANSANAAPVTEKPKIATVIVDRQPEIEHSQVPGTSKQDGGVASGSNDSARNCAVAVELPRDAAALHLGAAAAHRWRHVIKNGCVKSVAASPACVAAAVRHDGDNVDTLYAWRTKCGLMLDAPLCLNGKVAVLKCDRVGRILVVLENAQCFAVDAVKCKTLVPFVSLASLLSGAHSITSCSISSGGSVSICRSDGKQFAYDARRQCWCLLRVDASLSDAWRSPETQGGLGSCERSADLSGRLQSDVLAAGMSGSGDDFISSVHRWISYELAQGADSHASLISWIERLSSGIVITPPDLSKTELLNGCRKLCLDRPDLMSAIDGAIKKVSSEVRSEVITENHDKNEVTPAMDCL